MWTGSLVEDVVADLSVHGTEGVVQQVYVRIAVESPREADAGLLPPTQTHPPISNQRPVALRHQLKVLKHRKLN